MLHYKSTHKIPLHLSNIAPTKLHLPLVLESDFALHKDQSTVMDSNAFIERIDLTSTSISDPEDTDQSDVLSFDEDDMYGSDIGDDVMLACLDSDPDSGLDMQTSDADMVCHSVHSHRLEMMICMALLRVMMSCMHVWTPIWTRSLIDRHR